MRIILFIFLVCTQNFVYAQTVISDSVPVDNAENVKCPDLRRDNNWAGKYRSRGYYADGKRCHESKCGLFNVFRSKKWDRHENLIMQTRQYPFKSTSYKITLREKRYYIAGVLVEHSVIRKQVSCFGGHLIRSKIKTFDEKGRLTSTQKVGRIKAWKMRRNVVVRWVDQPIVRTA